MLRHRNHIPFRSASAGVVSFASVGLSANGDGASSVLAGEGRPEGATFVDTGESWGLGDVRGDGERVFDLVARERDALREGDGDAAGDGYEIDASREVWRETLRDGVVGVCEETT